MAMTDFTIIRRSMAARLFSTTITILTVALSVGLMLLLLSMRDSGQKAFERGSGNMHLLISRDSSALTSILNGVFYASPPQRPIEWSKFEEISGAFPWEFAVPVQLGDSYLGRVPVLATTPEFFSQYRPDPDRPWSLSAGRFFQSDFEVVLGAAAARDAGLGIGDRLYLTHGVARSREAAHDDHSHDSHAHDDHASDPAAHGDWDADVHREFVFTVVGVLDPTGAAHDRAMFTSLQSAWILHAHERRARAAAAAIPLTTAADLADSDRLITGIYARVLTPPGSAASSALPQIFDQLRRDTSLTVAQPADQIRKLFQIVTNINYILLAMAAAVMVTSGIGIMLALYNSMEQRRRQIAVLRVLGCSRGRIFGLILTESALIGLAGAVLGLVFCIFGSFATRAAIVAILGLVIEPAFDPRSMVAVLLGSVLLASFAGLVPALAAYRTPVVRNLRPLA